MRVLVTGFEPFGDNPINISKQVALALPREIDVPDPYGHSSSVQCAIETLVLSVDEVGSKLVANLEKEFDYIIHLGLCETCDKPRIESKACNELDFRIADNSGRKISGEEIIKGAKDLLTTLPIKKWDSGLVKADLEFSEDAGRYLCNETYFRTLYAKGDQCGVLFVHLPNSETSAGLSTFIDVLSLVVHPPIIDVAAGLIRNAEGDLLALRRCSTVPHSGKWEIPGGRIESGETSGLALKRELQEELSLDVEVGKLVGIWEESTEVRLRLHVHEVIVDKEPQLSVHDQIRWGTNLAELDWLDIDRRLLEELNAI